MHNPVFNKIYEQILAALNDKKTLSDLPIDKIFIKKHIENKDFKAKLNELLQGSDFSCKAVFNLCCDMLSELSDYKHPSENWLMYIYEYALNLSFPEAVTIEINSEFDDSCKLYLIILRIICEYQKNSEDDTWQSKYAMKFLTKQEEDNLENPLEYKSFLNAFNNEYIYEMMKLNQEVMSFNTLDHICGVHYLALLIGRQFFSAGLPIDLGRVSGAAAGHDIGKYGCRQTEAKKVPYLHYYYTDMWFKNHDIDYIGHIAVNHSTWDLELESLPLESLILIYSDFRVKNNSQSNMSFYTLKDSFDIILNKLDNVDAKKEKRYKRVYSKLKDFEDYMLHIGINVEPDILSSSMPLINKNKKRSYSLMQGEEIVNNIKYLSINHNLNLMYRLRDESSLNAILEAARSERDWKNLREYLEIFEEYSTYLTQKQKLITLKFLYDKLIHSEDDIRRQCAELIGTSIATFNVDYRKDIPEDAELPPAEITSSDLLDNYINLFIMSDHKIIPKHRKWISSSLSAMINSFFKHCNKKQIPDFINIISKYYDTEIYSDEDAILSLISSANYVPVIISNNSYNNILDYLFNILDSENYTYRLSALEVIYNLLSDLKDTCFINNLKDKITNNAINSTSIAESYLVYNICKELSLSDELIKTYSLDLMNDSNRVTEVFLSNLKSATNKIIKNVQVNMITEYALNNPNINGLYTAMHLCNLLKVSPVENIRNKAGEALIKIVPCLTFEQRNDVAIELLRALELDGYQFAKYIPSYLGRLILFLPPVELDELIDDFIDKIKQSSPQINSLLLKTIGIAIENYSSYIVDFKEDKNKFFNRLIRLLGILLNGMVNFNVLVKQSAFSVIGKEIFSSEVLTLEEKKYVFTLIAKKILTLLTDSKDIELLLLTNSASLNHIYKFISNYLFYKGEIGIKAPEKVAFFPGTFDPFSLSHKEIAKEIRDLGFEVYLQVDEFSWSKKTLPSLIRRNIINMSIADELNIYLYPEDIPTNIANPDNLKTLKENFSNSEVYIVAGSDVILNASAYRQKRTKYSIQNFSHIIFERKSTLTFDKSNEKSAENFDAILGKKIILSLEPRYENISSTQIRSYIDENRDISTLIDPLAQKYIYKNSYYRSEPQYKALIKPLQINIDKITFLSDDNIKELLMFLKNNCDSKFDEIETGKLLRSLCDKPSSRFIIIRDADNNNGIIGFSAFHWLRSNLLYQEIRNKNITEYIRENAIGRIVLIDTICVNKDAPLEHLEQIVLTETLALCLSRDYDYALYRNIIDGNDSLSLSEMLELQGFIKLPYEENINPIYAVNMNNPCSLNLDINSIIKEPFRHNKNIRNIIVLCRKRLQKAFTNIYPGHLVLSFDRTIMYQSIVRKVCDENGVPAEPTFPKKLGPYMCVPFGNILKRHVVPNTVTKALHTEKLCNADIENWKIGAFPYYLNLDTQVKVLKAFNKPVILVDDMLHKGYRMQALDPILKKENIKVQKIIVGILSGRGKELMDIQNRSDEVESAYFIPKLNGWFTENSMYPFMGGDTIWRGTIPQGNLVPSINMILPYASPTFINNAEKGSIYELSKVCLENSIEIFSVIESEYQRIYERTLTLDRLGEVFVSPRCPDHGENMYYDVNLSPTNYLKNDLSLLKRIEFTVER